MKLLCKGSCGVLFTLQNICEAVSPILIIRCNKETEKLSLAVDVPGSIIFRSTCLILQYASN